MKALIAVAATLVAAISGLAATGVSLTVYNDNLALVRDTRMMDYKSGAGELLFRDVAGQIDATSVHFNADGVTMLEQNFDYDLVSADKLLEKYIDKPLEVVMKGGDVVKGKLLTASGAQLTLQQDDGSIRSVLTESATEIRYPNLPDGLITRPTLRWLVNARGSGSKETEVAYLTSGISWHADYVLVLNEKNDHAEVAGWVTLDNKCGTSFKDAKLKLIAGEPHRVQPPMPTYRMMDGMAKAQSLSAPQFQEQSFFEYHLYTLQRPTTVLDNQTKQVSLFPSATAGTKKIYEYDPRLKSDRVGVSLEIENKEANGLGMPLPAGRVRMYQKGPDGSEEFIGEDSIEHTPTNEKLTVQVGDAFDIAVEKTQVNFRQISNRVTETDYQVKIRNHKKEDVEVVVVDYFWGDWSVTQSSLDYNKVSANKVEFKVAAKSEQEAVLTYTVRIRS